MPIIAWCVGAEDWRLRRGVALAQAGLPVLLKGEDA
jgi:hypothetical protein